MIPIVQPDVEITRVFERHACYFVEGVVRTECGWQKAAFTVSKPDVFHMSREDFEAFAKRNLPDTLVDKKWVEVPV